MWVGRLFLTLAAVFAAAALLAAGCGGDDPAPVEPVDVGGDESPAPLSKNAFIAQGDAICGEANAALSALETGTVGSDPEAQATQELEITRSELQSLQSLTPPDSGRSVLDSFLSALQDQVDALTRKQTAVQGGGDPAAADAEASSAASSAQAAAQDYGFTDCANASVTTPAGGTTTVPAVTTPTTPTATVPATPTPPATGNPGTAGGTGAGGGSTGGSSGGGGGSSGGGTGGTGGGISP